MKLSIARSVAGIAAGMALMAAAVPAIAADMGAIKDYGGAGGVPVPAPVPIPEYDAEWYIGVAAGGTLWDNSAIEEIGSSLPVRDSDDLAKTLFGGVSFGRYVAPNFRMELAVEAYGEATIAGPEGVKYTDAVPIDDTDYVGHYNVTRTDRVRVGRTTAMINAYYDIPLSQRLKPYIGAGIGVTWRSMKRRALEQAVCDFSTLEEAGTDPVTYDNCKGVPQDLRDYRLSETTYEKNRFDLALSAMAGISYELTPDIIWDNGYQFLWESGELEITSPTHAGELSTVKYGDTTQHQFRTGLRFLID